MQSDVECSGGDGEIDGSLQPGVGKLTNSQSREIKLNLVGEIKQQELEKSTKLKWGNPCLSLGDPFFLGEAFFLSLYA